MKKHTIIFLISYAISSCQLKFQQVNLYDKYEEPKNQEMIESVIYSDAEGTMWHSLFNCGEFKVSNKIYYKGKASIKISWDKNLGCEWIGFGNSFNNWQPVNIQKNIENKALSFYIRTHQGEVNSIPIVASLEDFSGGGSYVYIDSKKYLKGLSLDTNWKQVIVPLWDFPIRNEAENDDIDISSIKQFKFQLEGSGKFYLDEISLIEYSRDQYNAMQLELEKMKPTGEKYQQIYKEGILTKSAWGTGEKICHSLNEKRDSTGNTFIKWKYKTENCSWAKWGINWNNWNQINFRGITSKSILEFKLKTDSDIEFYVSFEDFKGHSSSKLISIKETSDVSQWKVIKIPLKEFNFEEKKFVLDQIKQLTFRGGKSGKVLLDDIKIVSNEVY